MVSFTELSDLARSDPVISPLPKLADLYLDDIAIYPSVDRFHEHLYDPEFLFEHDVVITADTRHPRYQRIECDQETITPDLNDVVDWSDAETFDYLSRELIAQSELKNHIQDTITGERLVVLVIVDGLSYEALRTTDLNPRPVIVDGISTTEPGFRRIIYGDPDTPDVSVAAELMNKKKFYNSIGFTYWERGQESLSTELHAGMGDSIHRISDFEEAVTTLRDKTPLREKTYVQITRMGLDQDSHNRKEDPPRDAVVESLLDDLRQLLETVSALAERFRVFVTADHGILWRENLPSEPSIVCDEYHPHARFIEGRANVPEGRVVVGAKDSVTIGLAYPHLTRELENTEWGVHGGFSYDESVVPLVELTEDDTL